MIIENATVIDIIEKTEFNTNVNYLSIVVTIIIITLTLAIISTIYASCYKHETGKHSLVMFPLSVTMIISTIALGLIAFDEVTDYTIYTAYVVVFDYDIDNSYIYENYEILDYDGLFYTIIEKEREN